MHIILYFDYICISLQVQDLVEDSETMAIEEAETETKIDDLEESDMDANDIESKTDVSYVYSKLGLLVSNTYTHIHILYKFFYRFKIHLKTTTMRTLRPRRKLRLKP